MSTFVSRSRNATMIGHVSEERIAAMGADYVQSKARQTAALAREHLITTGAVRSGALLHSIGVDRRLRMGSRTTAVVRAGAGHAAYVHEGTYGPIKAKNKRWLKVPIKKYSTLKVRRVSVAGQDANPFLADPLAIVMAPTFSPFGPRGLLRDFSF
jgi:hypothetical protein